VIAAVKRRLAGGLGSFAEGVAAQARASLTPGHGYLTGQLARSIRTSPIRDGGTTLETSVGAFGVSYSMIMHDRYEYIVQAMQDLRGDAASMITGG
jgi:hypothetical protein